MLHSTRFLALSLLCAVVAVPSAGCDPCAAEPDLCAGLPGGFGTDGMLDVDDAGERDGGGRRHDPGGDAPANAGGTDDGAAEGGGEGDVDGGEVAPDETGGDETGGDESGGGESGGGESGGGESGEGESGATLPDPHDELVCYDRYGACLQGGGIMYECRVELRACLADVGAGTPDGDCLDAITECMLEGNDPHGCVVGDAAASCVM